MLCPNCRYEYLPGVKICPDCGAELVAQLPPIEKEEPMPVDETKLVTVLITSDLTLVAIAKSILEEAKIEYYARGADPAYRLATYYARMPVEIQVDDKHANEARELLKDLENSEIMPDDNFSEEDNEP